MILISYTTCFWNSPNLEQITTENSPKLDDNDNDDFNSVERSALIRTNQQLDVDLQEAESKLYLLNKRLLDHFKRKKVLTQNFDIIIPIIYESLPAKGTLVICASMSIALPYMNVLDLV